MSWHPYQRNSRLWTIYWEERPAPPTGGENANALSAMSVFELTEPYCLDRDQWRELQISLLLKLAPPDYTLNISQLWGRNWPRDASFRFNRIHDSHKLPNLLSADCYQNVQPTKRESFYWVMAETPPRREFLDDLVWYQGIDFENITWITKEPINPFPTQLFEFNKVALGWRNKDVSLSELDEVIRQECWGFSLTHLGHLNLRIPTSSLENEQIWESLRSVAADFNLDIQSTSFDKKPKKPALLQGCLVAPINLLLDGWGKFKQGFRR